MAFEPRRGRRGRQNDVLKPAAVSSDGMGIRNSHLENLPRLEAIAAQSVALQVYCFASARPEPQTPVHTLMAKLSINGGKPVTVSIVLGRDDLSYIEAAGGLTRATRLHRKLESAIARALMNGVNYSAAGVPPSSVD